MCVKPAFVWVETPLGYLQQEVPCRKCWACLKNRVNDVVGRALCEASTSDYVYMLNLTYDDLLINDRAQKETIVKADLQRFFMLLRKRYKCRYLAAGEFGERKGRAHFHAVIFGMGIPPQIPLKKERVYIKDDRGQLIWPWGYCYAEDARSSERAMRYVAKYAVKQWTKGDSDERSEEWLTYSRKPLLGAKFIYEKATQQAEMQVFPRTFNYLPPGADHRNVYSFYGKAQEVYFDALFADWPEAHDAPKTDWMQNAYTRYLKKKQERRFKQLGRNFGSHVQAWYLWQAVRFQKSKLTRNQILRIQGEYQAQIDNERLRKWLAEKEKAQALGEEIRRLSDAQRRRRRDQPRKGSRRDRPQT